MGCFSRILAPSLGLSWFRLKQAMGARMYEAATRPAIDWLASVHYDAIFSPKSGQRKETAKKQCNSSRVPLYRTDLQCGTPPFGTAMKMQPAERIILIITLPATLANRPGTVARERASSYSANATATSVVSGLGCWTDGNPATCTAPMHTAHQAERGTGSTGNGGNDARNGR